MQRRCELFRRGATRRGWTTSVSAKSGTYSTWRILLLCKQYTTPLPRFHRSYIAGIGCTIGLYSVGRSGPFWRRFLYLLSFPRPDYLMYHLPPHAASHWHFFQSLGNKYNGLFKSVLSVTYCMLPQGTLIAVRPRVVLQRILLRGTRVSFPPLYIVCLSLG